jgi:hypothetical protein
MKREWILGLATAAGMSLLAAMPVFGGDKIVMNIKKPGTDTNKPVVNVSKQTTKGDNLSAKSNNPASDVKKSSEKKDQSVNKITQPAVNAKAVVNSKPANEVKPAAIVQNTPKSNPAVNVKTASNVKPAPSVKLVTVAKPATFVKPIVNTKSVTNEKKPVIAKPASLIEKTGSKAKVKRAVISKPITMNKPVATVKLAANTKVVEKTKPVVIATPAVNKATTVIAKPVVDNKSVTNTKATPTAKPEIKSKKQQAPASKKISANKPEAAKTIANNAVPVKLASSIQLPSGWEQINLSNDQRDKAVVIADKYAVEIRKMESQLEAAKANREKELSALLTAQQRSQFANLKGQVQSKPMTNVGRAQPVNGKVKPEIKKTTMVKRDNTLASAAPIAIDKPAKKGRGKK